MSTPPTRLRRPSRASESVAASARLTDGRVDIAHRRQHRADSPAIPARERTTGRVFACLAPSRSDRNDAGVLRPRRSMAEGGGGGTARHVPNSASGWVLGSVCGFGGFFDLQSRKLRTGRKARADLVSIKPSIPQAFRTTRCLQIWCHARAFHCARCREQLSRSRTFACSDASPGEGLRVPDSPIRLRRPAHFIGGRFARSVGPILTPFPG